MKAFLGSRRGNFNIIFKICNVLAVPNCTGGMVYSTNASPCLVTCQNPRAVELCTLPNTETCLCPPGTAFNGQECVLPEQCGCVDEQGIHHKVVTTFYILIHIADSL